MFSPNGSVLDVHYPCFHNGAVVFLFVLILSRGLCFRGGEDMNFSKFSKLQARDQAPEEEEEDCFDPLH